MHSTQDKSTQNMTRFNNIKEYFHFSLSLISHLMAALHLLHECESRYVFSRTITHNTESGKLHKSYSTIFLPTFIRNNSVCDKILKYFGNQIAVVVSRVS